MMAERRAIRQARIDEAIRQSERKRFWFDLIVGGTLISAGLAVIVGLFMLVL
jgi:hypothetical protein